MAQPGPGDSAANFFLMRNSRTTGPGPARGFLGLKRSMTPDIEIRWGRQPEWPDDVLDVDALIARGREPLPLRQFLLKLHSRCNLACDYCYVYTMADQGWRAMPRQMPAAIVDLAAARIAEHVRRHGIDRIQVILHGGEPLLAGVEAISYVAARVREAVGGAAAVDRAYRAMASCCATMPCAHSPDWISGSV